MPKTPESQLRWEKENRLTISCKVGKNTDREMYEFISGLENKNAYLKDLIRADMKRKQSKAAAGLAEILPHINLKGE